jgi:hypothetical protein
MKEKLVTVARFADYMEADLARQLLEDEGISAFVMGMNVGTVYSGVPAVTDIHVQTPESQAREAREILEAHRHPQEEDSGQSLDDDLEWDEDLEQE